MRKIIFIAAVCACSYGYIALGSDDPEVEVCPGSGETCKVTKGGLGNPFSSKGKDDSAIVIKL